MSSETANVFSRIYSSHEWGGTSRSGPGSDPALVQLYLSILKSVIATNNVSSVVDIGCGDWSLSRTIDWTGIDYTGVDIVPGLVDTLNSTFSGEHVRFVCADLARDELPGGDLCVVKDVLQHLSNRSVQAFLEQLRHKYQLAVITNDTAHVDRTGWRTFWGRTHMEPNRDIPDGGYRPLRLTDPPFQLQAQQLRTFTLRLPRQLQGHPGTVFETKEILLWRHPQNHTGEGV
jgi:SAM-dependent methyltransferase